MNHVTACTHVSTPRQPLWLAVRFALLCFVLAGLYSAASTALNQWCFPNQATGSLLYRQGQLVGSALVAQPFRSDRYFHGRPSAVATDPMNTAGSNLAPTNPQLAARVEADSRALSARLATAPSQLPVDLLATSGSGIDPDISPAAALLQVAVVANARHCAITSVEALVRAHIESPVLGPQRVNVLQLNLALDQACPAQS